MVHEARIQKLRSLTTMGFGMLMLVAITVLTVRCLLG